MAEEQSSSEVVRIMSCTSHYEVLGVSITSSDADVKRTYRTLALHTHPDKNKHAKAEDAFKRVTAAYQTLDTGDKRTRYSQVHGGRGFKHHEDRGGGGDHGGMDGFDDMFGGGGGFDAHSFFASFMQAHMAGRGGRGGGGRGGRGGAGGLEAMFLMMMMEQMMRGGGGGGFYDEDGDYYEDEEEYYDEDDDDEYYDEYYDEDDDDEAVAPLRPGQFDRKLNKFVCPKCDVKTDSREDMNAHLANKRHATAMNKLEFHCQHCDITTHTKTEKHDHLASKKHLRALRKG